MSYRFRVGVHGHINNSFLDNFGDCFAAAMFEPMAIGNRDDRDHRNCKKYADNTGDLSAGENRENDCEWMQVNAGTDYPRAGYIVVHVAPQSQKEQLNERFPKSE